MASSCFFTGGTVAQVNIVMLRGSYFSKAGERTPYTCMHLTCEWQMRGEERHRWRWYPTEVNPGEPPLSQL
jgi:hypothetical protein